MTDFILSVWREACKRLDLEPSADRIARLIAPRLPADVLILRRLDVPHTRIETAAMGVCRREPVLGNSRTSCTPEDFNRVIEWCRAGSLLRGRTNGREPLMRLLAPANTEIDWIAGPLARDGEPLGVMLL